MLSANYMEVLMDWNEKAWGSKSDYHIDDRESLEGWKVGETIMMLEDDEEAPAYAGDLGEVVGIAHHPGGMFSAERDELIVLFEDQDEPVGVSPYSVGEEGDDLFGEE